MFRFSDPYGICKMFRLGVLTIHTVGKGLFSTEAIVVDKQTNKLEFDLKVKNALTHFKTKN